MTRLVEVQEIAQSAEDSKARRDARGWLVACSGIRCDKCGFNIRGLGHWDGQHHKRNMRKRIGEIK